MEHDKYPLCCSKTLEIEKYTEALQQVLQITVNQTHIFVAHTHFFQYNGEHLSTCTRASD
jgi:hypothetical protein